MWHWLFHVLAWDSTTDDYYAANSGSLGSWILPPLFTVSGFAALIWWHSRCHLEKCLRHGKFDADGHKICHVHARRPKKLTLEHLAHFHNTGKMPRADAQLPR
jgi:hypothetical protein